MPLPLNHPVNEAVVQAHSPSVGASAVTAYARAPFRGKVIKVGSVLYGAITPPDATGPPFRRRRPKPGSGRPAQPPAADATVAATINGTAITGGAITITQSGSAAGQVNTATPTAANDVNEDDTISFPPTGAGGSNIA